MRYNNHFYLDFSQLKIGCMLHDFFLCKGVLCLQTIAFPYESSTVLTPGCNAVFRVGVQVENRFIFKNMNTFLHKYIAYPLGSLRVLTTFSW